MDPPVRLTRHPRRLVGGRPRWAVNVAFERWACHHVERDLDGFLTEGCHFTALFGLGEPTQRHHDVEAVTAAEHTGHGDRSGEMLEVLGGGFGHLVECDEGCDGRFVDNVSD